MKPLDNAYFYPHKAQELANLRREARCKRRLTYDCMNAIVQGNTVICRNGHQFKGNKGMGLLAVLRGRSSSQCQKCTDYDEETSE